jgi:hypothetical protein
MLKELVKAKQLANNLGTRCAAGYMRNRNWTIDAALWTLCKTTVRP